MDFPRIMIDALRGGSGKTILSIGLIAAWKKCNRSIAAFKKGPDYIDTGWLAMAADRPCYNLDTFLLETPQILQSFLDHTLQDDIAVIEGYRGLFDGIDLAGSTSTAELGCRQSGISSPSHQRSPGLGGRRSRVRSPRRKLRPTRRLRVRWWGQFDSSCRSSVLRLLWAWASSICEP